MKLSSLRIRGAVESPGLRSGGRGAYLRGELPLHGVTIVLGANSSGKTSLLELVELALGGGDWSDEYGRSVLRMHMDTVPEVLVAADYTEDSDDRKMLGRVITPEHPRFETVDNVFRSIAGITFGHGLALTVHESPGIPSPQLAELREWAAQGLLEVQYDGDGDLEIALALPPHATADVPFHERVVGYLPERLAKEVMPQVAVAPAELVDSGALADSQVREVVHAWLPGLLRTPPPEPDELPDADRWLIAGDDGSTHIAPGILEIVELLEAEIQRLLPSFVAAEGTVRLLALRPDQWRNGPRIALGIERDGHFRRAEGFGSGTRRWIYICLLIASRRLRQWQYPEEEGPYGRHDRAQVFEAQGRMWRNGGFREHLKRSGAAPMLLIDEPELHLHPDAQKEVATWFSRRVGTGDLLGVIVATHSPSMLTVDHEELNLVLLRREPDVTQIEVIDDDVLNALDQAAVSQGFGRDAWFFATRAILLVEGEHDLQVLERFYGHALRQLRVRMLALRGAGKVRRVLDSEFLGASGFPLYVLLDNMLLDRVRTAASPEGLTEEERQAFAVVKQAERDDVRFLSYPEPDILCALPMRTVVRRYPHTAETVEDVVDERGYWDHLIKRWRAEVETSGQRTSFKVWVATEVLGLNRDTQLVPEALRQTTLEDEPSPALVAAIEELRAHLANEGLWR